MGLAPGMACLMLDFLVDLEKWGLDNPHEVWFAADRPYGLIEAAVVRDDVPPADHAWAGIAGFV